MRLNPAFAQRQVAIAAVALLAVVVGLAVATRDGGSSTSDLPEAIPAPGGGWYHARAAASGRALEPGGRTQCGYEVTGNTMGVAHPVLPCGVKLYIGYKDKEVLTQVIARGPEEPSLQFGLTDALARELEADGPVTIRYRFVREE
ncbi:MAG TPA: hypothetical protein VE615_02695 [Gaiellaceae bacterium]|nr:hypothetical protein [Gaiellaceae bacterium]